MWRAAGGTHEPRWHGRGLGRGETVDGEGGVGRGDGRGDGGLASGVAGSHVEVFEGVVDLKELFTGAEALEHSEAHDPEKVHEPL